MYGFQRVNSGPDQGSYFHDLFLKNRPDLCKMMLRQRLKNSNKLSSSLKPTKLPNSNFYSLPPCAIMSTSNNVSNDPNLNNDNMIDSCTTRYNNVGVKKNFATSTSNKASKSESSGNKKSSSRNIIPNQSYSACISPILTSMSNDMEPIPLPNHEVGFRDIYQNRFLRDGNNYQAAMPPNHTGGYVNHNSSQHGGTDHSFDCHSTTSAELIPRITHSGYATYSQQQPPENIKWHTFWETIHGKEAPEMMVDQILDPIPINGWVCGIDIFKNLPFQKCDVFRCDFLK